MTATVVPFQPWPSPAFVPERVLAPDADVPDADVPDAETLAVEETEDFETLRNRGRELVARGAYREAAAVYRAAMDVAIAAGEVDLADEALCGWGAAETELGNGVKVMPKLRRILLDSIVDHNRWLAAYTIARAHELQGATRKALFYARLSRDISTYVDRPGLMGGSYNLLGNLHVAEGRESEAAVCYRKALRQSAGAPSLWKAQAEGNLGYCLVVGSACARRSRRTRIRLREGLKLIYRSLRIFRRERAVYHIALAHMDLCFAHLELKRLTSARRHGRRALELAGQCHGADCVAKNSLYLLGEVALLEGDTEAARRCLGEMGRRFYPDHSGLTDMLMALDLRQIVNLRA